MAVVVRPTHDPGMRHRILFLGCLPILTALAGAVACSSSDTTTSSDAGPTAPDAAIDTSVPPPPADAAPDSSVCANGAFAWATPGGGMGQGNAVHGVAIDKDGNTWVSGTFIAHASWGSATLTATDTVHAVTFFAKLDKAGKVLFARTLDSPESNIADSGGRIRVDPQGNAYIVGTFEKTLTLDTVTLTQDDALGAGAAFVIKVDTTGKAVWGVASANNGGSSESGRDVAVDPTTGDVYLVGSYNGQAVFFDPGTSSMDGGVPAVMTTPSNGGEEKAFIAKFSQTQMKWRWAKGWIGSGNDGGVAHAVALDTKNGNVSVFGDIVGEITVEGTNLTAAGGSFIATLAQSDGHLVWATELDPGTGSSASALVRGATYDAAGNVYVAGEFRTATTFKPAAVGDAGAAGDAGAPITLTPTGGTDAFLAKYDATGVPVWAKHGGDGNGVTRADDVAFDGQSGVYISGFTQSATFGGKTFAHTGSLFVARYDTAGTIQWLSGNDVPPNDARAGEASGLAVVSPTDGVVVGGSFGASPTTLGSLEVKAIGDDTGLVTRLCN